MSPDRRTPRARRRPRAPARALARLLGGAGAVLALAPAGAASAHPLAPALLELREAPDGRVEVALKVSRWRTPGAEVAPRLPDGCAPLAEPAPEARLEATALVRRRWLDCGPAGLAGRRIGVAGLGDARIDALVRVELRDGRRVQRVLRAGDAAWQVPLRPGRGDVVRSYAALGAAHILGGLDHLLFVFGLLLLVDGRRRLVGTVTAFTAGHSVTLAAAVLGPVRLPSAWVELAIAASVFVLALELARPDAGGRPSALRRRPWLAAGGFGLLHGLGFAAALREAGLPAGEVPLALASFNLGVELGQLAFVAGVLVLGGLAGAVAARLPARLGRALVPRLRHVPVYALGGLAAYWCLERAVSLV